MRYVLFFASQDPSQGRFKHSNLWGRLLSPYGVFYWYYGSPELVDCVFSMHLISDGSTQGKVVQHKPFFLSSLLF